jgi:hypothetical protein
VDGRAVLARTRREAVTASVRKDNEDVTASVRKDNEVVASSTWMLSLALLEAAEVTGGADADADADTGGRFFLPPRTFGDCF